jgi:hypothetical protein
VYPSRIQFLVPTFLNHFLAQLRGQLALIKPSSKDLTLTHKSNILLQADKKAIIKSERGMTFMAFNVLV